MKEYEVKKQDDLNVDLIAHSLETGKAMIDDGKKTWNQLVKQILNKNGRVIALRGAGRINGADLEESNKLLETQLIPRVEQALAAGEQVTFMFDGDLDSPDKPDIGYFVGRLVDRFGNNSNGVSFITAQRQKRYNPRKEGGNLANANGKDYVTYVFADNTYPGDHNSFTQDSELVQSEKYEQWYIGASGKTASAQLSDFDSKVPHGQKREAVLFRVHNNSALNGKIQEELNATRAAGDEVQVNNFEEQLIQRERVYGVHWTNDGKPAALTQYPNLQITFIT